MAKRSKPKRGQGAVRLHDGRYQASVQLSGKRYWQSFDKEADAWKWIATLKADAVRGILKVQEEKPSNLTFDDLARLYRIDKAPGWRPGTVRFFDGHVKTTLKPEFEGRPISKMTTAELQGFISRKRSLVSAMTCKKYVQLLRQLFNYAVRMGYLKSSPMAGVEAPRVNPTEKRRLATPRAPGHSCELSGRGPDVLHGPGVDRASQVGAVPSVVGLV